MVQIGRETKQGFERNIQALTMTDLYSYSLSALVATEFLRMSRARNTGLEMGFCIAALRQVTFTKIRRDSNRINRLPLGTLYWGKRSLVPRSISKDKRLLMYLLEDLQGIISIWPSTLEKQHSAD